MKRALCTFAATLWLLGCQPSGEPSGRLAGDSAEPATENEPEGTLYGEALDAEMPLTTLGDIAADPEQYRGQVVRTHGEIARVCQQAGCWMELRDGEDGPAVRVPMAGHAFFLPRDSAGRHATMQGRVAIQHLSQEWREHLEAEGAVETRSALSINATGVVID